MVISANTSLRPSASIFWNEYDGNDSSHRFGDKDMGPKDP
jgi:hypothetical protein